MTHRWPGRQADPQLAYPLLLAVTAVSGFAVGVVVGWAVL